MSKNKNEALDNIKYKYHATKNAIIINFYAINNMVLILVKQNLTIIDNFAKRSGIFEHTY